MSDFSFQFRHPGQLCTDIYSYTNCVCAVADPKEKGMQQAPSPPPSIVINYAFLYPSIRVFKNKTHGAWESI